MKDRTRKARVPVLALVAWCANDGAEDPEEGVSDLVYARDKAEAARVAWRHGQSGAALKANGSPFPPDVFRIPEGDHLARKATHPKVDGKLASMRVAGFRFDDERVCEKCDRSSAGETTGPWAVCSLCYQCGECGHDDKCEDHPQVAIEYEKAFGKAEAEHARGETKPW